MKKEELAARFNRMFKGCQLFAIQLDGFSHRVFYKDKNGDKHIDMFTGCAPEQYQRPEKYYNARGDYAWRSINEDKTKIFFLGFPHYEYQCAAEELIYMPLSKWRE